MPHRALGVREAIRRALDRVRSNAVDTRWSVAGAVPGDPEWAGGTVFTDARSITIDATPAEVSRAVCRIGGGHGWYAGDILWRIRGWMDTLVGGPGLRRGRRHPERVEFGETLDFWRVIGVEEGKSLALLAEMKLPGTATLNLEVWPAGGGNASAGLVAGARTELRMTARIQPIMECWGVSTGTRCYRRTPTRRECCEASRRRRNKGKQIDNRGSPPDQRLPHVPGESR
jgi:Protein of unknown function (DUF2867)